MSKISLDKRAGELKEADIETINKILANPTEWGVPKWFLNRPSDPREGTSTQLIANQVDTKLREDIERLKKIKNHRGLRHHYGLKVRGQHTNSTGRKGRTLGVQRKK